jgi:hypothetical protein
MWAPVKRSLIASGVTVPVVISCTLLAGRWGRELAGFIPSFIGSTFGSAALRVCSVFEGHHTSDIIFPPKLSNHICFWMVVLILAVLLSTALGTAYAALGIPRLAAWSPKSRNYVCLGWAIATLLVAVQIPPLRELLRAQGSLDLDAAESVRLWLLYTGLAIALPIGTLMVAWRRSRERGSLNGVA